MSSTSDKPTRYKLVFTSPTSSVEACKSAVFAKGAGSHPPGTYSLVSFQSTGTTQFLPSANAHPAIGEPGKLEKVDETRVEVLCVGREVVQGAVEALKRAHPYEEPGYEVYKLEDF